MTDLSPEALSVWCRFCEVVEDHGPPRLGLARALRVAADQVVPPEQETPWGSVIQAHAAELRIRNELLAIADELEAQ